MAARNPGSRRSTARAAGDDEASARHILILQRVREIPRGCVATYGQIARLAGLPGRARLVGQVLGEAGAASVPWHRVINAQGQLSLPKISTSYVEQRRRLREEGVMFRNDRIDLRRHQWRPDDDSPLLD